MRTAPLYMALLLPAFFVFTDCSGPEQKIAGDEPQPVNITSRDSAATLQKMQAEVSEGIIGIYNMPEMLALTKMDSSDVKDMSFKLAKDYSVLEEEAHAIGADLYGSPGAINYNNDPKNFKFECILPIKAIPAKEPTQCKVVMLEAGKMLVYNYYGAYANLFTAYNKIRIYCKAGNLTQSGPMREFYVTDPTVEKDPAKWMTRILVPVN